MQTTPKSVHLVYVIMMLLFQFCASANNDQQNSAQGDKDPIYHNHLITVGAERIAAYLPVITNKSVGLVVNQTSMVNQTHLADTLLTLGVNVKSIFAPEHGFRGTADAGETIKDGVDTKTGLPVVSLYGKNKKPTDEQLTNVDIIIFDIQDVGARFYTYISTLHYVMEAAAENDKTVIVLDRPNPNGFYVSGPMMEEENKSFVGMHSIPVVHGMTVGEYAEMINREGWLKNGITCNLRVVTCNGYDHSKYYELPIKPSPNLPNMRSIYLYPVLCLFEGTDISVGRGTDKQFQVLGTPNINKELFDTEPFTFIPIPKPGAKYPKHQDKECFGEDMTKKDVVSIRKSISNRLNAVHLRHYYSTHSNKDNFFNSNNFFDKLAGTKHLKELIIAEASTDEFTQLYNNGVEDFMKIRKKYLLYPDFD